jgi:hypothetical protein
MRFYPVRFVIALGTALFPLATAWSRTAGRQFRLLGLRFLAAGQIFRRTGRFFPLMG